MTKVLVTGGAGFIGSALVKRLVAEGFSVRVMDDYSRGVPSRLEEIADAIEMVQGDVRDSEKVDEAVKGVEIVYHLAAVNGTENFYKHPNLVLEVAVKGTLYTMDSAIKHGCAKYLLASSSEVYQQPEHCPTKENERIIIPDIQNPRFSYSGGKIAGELLAMHYMTHSDVEVITFRPHNIYGPDMGNEHVIPQLYKRLLEVKTSQPNATIKTFEIQGDGSQTRAFCYIDDCTDSIRLLAEKGKSGEIYHIGKDEEVTIAELAHAMAKEAGIQIELQHTDAPEGGTPRRCPDISKIQSLGYDPKVSLQEGLRKTYEGEWKAKDLQ